MGARTRTSSLAVESRPPGARGHHIRWGHAEAQQSREREAACQDSEARIAASEGALEQQARQWAANHEDVEACIASVETSWSRQRSLTTPTFGEVRVADRQEADWQWSGGTSSSGAQPVTWIGRASARMSGRPWRSPGSLGLDSGMWSADLGFRGLKRLLCERLSSASR